MRRWMLAVLVLLLAAGVAGAADTWQSDTNIVSGLGDVGFRSAPTVFWMDSICYLIAGEGMGTFIGYNWTGSTWQGDSAIASGLGSAGGGNAPAVFQMDGTWYLISGTAAECVGYNWTGSTWQSDSSIVAGLGSYYYGYPDATVYQMDGTWYLIESPSGATYGHNWTGSTWQSDSSILAGLGGTSPDTIFHANGTWYLINGYMASESSGAYEGYNWTGSTWQSDSGIVSGLTAADTQPYPCAFCLSKTWQIISGASEGTFNGYEGEEQPNRAITITNTSDWSGCAGGADVYVDYDATDPDGDAPTFSCDRTDLFTDFSTATGKGNWTAVVGVTTVVFGVSDGYGSTDNYTMTITVWAVGDTWEDNATIVGGLVSVSEHAFPTVFQKDGIWYLIAGVNYGDFDGYKWTGSTWQSDTGIVAGLGSLAYYSSPAVFEKDSTWYLVSGENSGTFYGFNWTGSTWQSDTNIVSGLGDVGGFSAPTVFEKDSTWYLVSGVNSGTFYGFNWTGSAWQGDSVIASGLGDVGAYSVPTVFEKDSTWYLIAGASDGVFNGFNWTGSTWQGDSVITSGLGDVGDYSTSTVFNKGSLWYLIAGEGGEGGGVFNGYNTINLSTPAPTSLTHIKNMFWVNHSWVVGSGVATDSYNVLINGTWHNNTVNTHYNNTLTTYGDWSNITVYAYNHTGGLSDGSVSEDVQLPLPMPATPSGAGSTWDYYWVNHAWTEGSSYGVWCGDTDSYNVSINGTWHNSTTNTYHNNTGLPPHGWSNASIYAFNNTGGINETHIYQSVQMANQAITITNTSDWIGCAGGVDVYVDYDATDPDGDTPTFSCNRTDLFADFDTATGTGNWTVVEGIYYVDFGVSDGWGSTDNYTMTITVWAGAVDMWVSNTTIISGLVYAGYSSVPTAFQKDGVWYLISGGDGPFNGYRWTGSTWQSNATIISGLGDVWWRSKPTVFEMGGTWYLISGRWSGAFNGFRWTGSTWQSDTNIVSGLGDVGDNSAPNVFQMYGVWYLISGEGDGVFNGYRWTGSTWQSNAAIVSGLSDVGSASVPTVSHLGGWYLISGEYTGVFNGYRWTGSTWQSNATIISGLGNVGEHSSPTTFQMDSVWYLISGVGDGVFYGHHLVSDAPKNLTHTTGYYWVNHTWEAGDGAPAHSYNVSINDVWHNTTTTYYNDTSLDDWGQWSNITVWGYNPIVGMSEMDGSDRVQIMPTLTPYNDFTGDNQVLLSPTDRHFTIEFKCTADIDIATWTWSCVDTSSGTSNSIETTATKYLNSWKGAVSVTASNGYGTTEAITWRYDITPPSYWFDPYYGQRDPILVINYCDGTGGTIYFYYVEMEVDTTNCVYSDCRDLFFYDPLHGYMLPFYTPRKDGVVQKTTDETIYVRMQQLIPGEQTIYMYSQCDEHGVLRPNQFGGYATIPDVDGVEKEFYSIPPCDDSEDVYVTSSGGMRVRVNESDVCEFKYLWGDVGSGVTWSCSDICDIGMIYLSTGIGTERVAYDQDLLLIQPGGAGAGLYIKSSKSLWASEDRCWVSIGGHDTHIPTGTGSYSFSIGGWTGTTTRLGVYRSWQEVSSAQANIYELYYIVYQDPNPCGVETIFRFHDYMTVVLYDDSGNLIPSANVAIYDTTADTPIQKWVVEADGIITFQVEDYSGHTMQIAVKTFDGVFIHDVYIDPDGGLTNITIPIHYNLNIHPQDQFGTPLTGVFAGLSEYTPLNPLSFWGFSMGGRQYVPVTNCSGFAMCDIYAEKGGYADYNVTALNWTSRSAMVKDYRHNVVLQKE